MPAAAGGNSVPFSRYCQPADVREKSHTAARTPSGAVSPTATMSFVAVIALPKPCTPVTSGGTKGVVCIDQLEPCRANANAAPEVELPSDQSGYPTKASAPTAATLQPNAVPVGSGLSSLVSCQRASNGSCC